MSVGLQRLRDDAETIRDGAVRKGEDPALVDRALELDAERRRLLAEGEALKAERNTVSKQIGEAIKGGAAADGPEVAGLREASTAAGEKIKDIDDALARAQATLDDLLLRIPNPPDPDIPVGGEEANVTIRTWGEPLPHDARKPHWELGDALGILDNARGAKIAGSGFPVYKGAGSALQRGLINWFLDVHTREHGMTEVWPPAVVNTASATGTGQIPDKEDQMYVVTRDDLYLVPTAEVPVTNLHRDEILEAADLPIRYAAYSPCFRREAGAAGKDTRGILRVHQFDKVEMVLFEKPEDSAAALEWMTERAEILLQRLGLAYRVLLMSTREMGFTQARKYDLEVWSPGVERWLEVSSCSNFRDFQARRMAIRYRPEAGAKPELVHTLNGSGLALARVVAALLETYQRPDGSIEVPEVLRPYHRARYHRVTREVAVDQSCATGRARVARTGPDRTAAARRRHGRSRRRAAATRRDGSPTHLRRPAAQPAVMWATPTETVGPAPGIEFAPHGARLVAYILDSILVTIVVLAFVIIASAVLFAGTTVEGNRVTAVERRRGGRHSSSSCSSAIILAFLYFPFFWARGGQTLGMKPFGLRVVRDRDGGRIGWGTALLRLVGLWIARRRLLARLHLDLHR